MVDGIENLLRQIRLGEDSALEFKRVMVAGHRVTDPDRRDFADEVAAFANGRGGMVLLGIDDGTREVIGIPIDRLDAVEAWLRDICNDSIKPPVDAEIRKSELPNSAGELAAVIRIEIPRSLFVHESPGGYFRRLGSSKRRLSPEALARLFQQRSQARLIRFDEQAVPGTSSESLDQGLASRFLAPESDLQDGARKLKLLTNDDDGVELASVSGVLMCTRAPQTWLNNAWIQAVAYRGVQQDSNYQLDAADLHGPLDQQVLDALHFVAKNQRVYATKPLGREDRPQYDSRAVFEALVNAVAHRDYSVYGSKIRLQLYQDRLVLFSPGGLTNTMEVDALRLRQSARNELIASLLARLAVPPELGLGRGHFMDRRGDGVPIILDAGHRLSGREPEYRVLDDAEVMLTIWAAPEPERPPV